MTDPQKSLTYDPLQKRLTVRNAESFPKEIFDYADDVEILDMSFGHLTSLPDDLGRLKKMRVAFLSHNDFEVIPEVLSTCESLEMVGFKSCSIQSIPDHSLPSELRGLILTDNKLKNLPASLGEYTSLQKLMLSGNQLQTLPEELLACKNLELLRLSVNSLSSPPDWLFHLPKLGWYSDAGNPFHGNDRIHTLGLKEISWNDIEIGEKLGESANNSVYHGRLRGGEVVAVKIYGSHLSTDGMPIDDMNACLLAGLHPNVIGGIGKLTNAPDNKQGLVMPLIADAFAILGKPPDLQTLTRDIYPQSQGFSHQYITQVLRDVANAMQHCHGKGIMHGDIYAHNILVNDKGNSFIGDFGAASLYTPNSEQGKLRERVDVKGFGYLIEDLLSHCSVNGSQESLQSLMKKCLEPDLTKRPAFVEIYDYLR